MMRGKKSRPAPAPVLPTANGFVSMSSKVFTGDVCHATQKPGSPPMLPIQLIRRPSNLAPAGDKRSALVMLACTRPIAVPSAGALL
jgi:hypothetical protein